MPKAKPSARPVVVALVSDVHCGSTIAPAPPEGVRLDDGGKYLPSRVQLWLWQCWESYWAEVGRRVKAANADLWCVFNGDLFDGPAHHKTTQTVSNHPEPQQYLAGRVFGVPKALKPVKVYIVRGTEVHVGPSGATEESFAQQIGAEMNEETGRWSWWHLRFQVHGVRFDCQHHGRMGQRPWTKLNVVSNLAAQIFYEHAARGLPHPHLAIRSHYHTHADTHDAHPTRVIALPAWQLKTAYAHRVVPESLADIGGVIATVTPDGRYEIAKPFYTPDLPPMLGAA